VAGEERGYIRWLHHQKVLPRCAVEGCFDQVSPIEANHSNSAEVHGGKRPEKRIGGRKGKGQRTNDSDAHPLCCHHHRQFTRGTGDFADMSKEQLRAWQRAQAARYWNAYSNWLGDRGITTADENDAKRRSLRVAGMDVDAEIELIVEHHQGENGNQLRLEIKGLCRRVASAASGGAVY
jgi:hypothetical protein